MVSEIAKQDEQLAEESSKTINLLTPDGRWNLAIL